MSTTLQVRGAMQQQLRAIRSRTRFHQLKLLQVWEGWALEDVIGACHQYGFTGIVVKALDGETWMANYDTGNPDAIRSVDQVAAQAERMRAEGLYYFAWTNPLDLTGADLALQATLTGQIATVCDGLFLDVEPYSQFWGADRPVGDAAQFMRWVRGEAPTAFIGLQPDPRPTQFPLIRPDEWLSGCDVLAGQHYWSDFGTTCDSELAHAQQLGQQWGVPILPTLPGNAGSRTFDMDLVAGLPGFIVWRWGTIPADTLALLGAAAIAGFISTRIAQR